MWTTLNFKGRSKTKIMATNICKRILHMVFERDWWIGLGPALGDGKHLKYIFPVSGIFPGKADSVILLGFECTINTQNLTKIVGAILEKIKIFIIFLCELPLILGLRGKLKKGSRYLREEPRYRFWTRSVNWFRQTFGDGQTYRQTNRHTHTHTHIHTDIFSKTHF